MKKILSATLALSMLLSLCGCSGDTNSTTSDQEVIYEEIRVEDENSSSSSTNSVVSSEETNSNEQSSVVDTSSETKPTVTEEKIVIDYNKTVEIDICDDVIRGYLDASTPRQQYEFLSQYDTMKLDYQVLPVRWKPDGSVKYTLHLSEKQDFSNAEIVTITGTYDGDELVGGQVAVTCVPGKTYYWKVYGASKESPRGGGKIKIVNQPVRWIEIDGVPNVRDMGGWTTESGKTIKYGKIYRGSRFDDITDKGIATLKKLGIKTDIDIRSTASWDSHGPGENTGLDYYFINTGASYDAIFRGDGTPSEEVRANYPQIFAMLADESYYPIYLHCNFGNDRTGTIAYIMNGLLGVNYEDLTRDYEITSYAFTHDRRWRGNGYGGTFGPNDLIQNNISNSEVDGRWGVLNKTFMESKYCTDGKLSTAIEAFLLDAGVQQKHIDAYKKIMLG
ncbi:MAG: tyrosine-protein phosphatase [Clostridia bacterium]|nr:tyrosine-protein phosphatase [Clostridia bacterium]